MSIIRPVLRAVVPPITQPIGGTGLPWESGGGTIAPPSAPTISGTVTIGGTLTITAGGGGPVTSYTLYRDGVSAGTVLSGYTYVAADIGPSLTVKAVGPGGTSAASNTLAWAMPSANRIADFNATLGVGVGYTLTSGRIDTAINQFSPGNDAVQGTAANRPVIATLGGPGGLVDAFDFTLLAGAAVWLRTGAIGMTGTTTIYTVHQSPASGRYVTDGATLDRRTLFASDATHLTMYAGSLGPSVSGQTAGTWIVSAARFNGASSKLRVNGGADATGDVGANTGTGLTLGNSGGTSASLCLNAKSVRHIYFNAVHDDATTSDVVAYLRNLYGL